MINSTKLLSSQFVGYTSNEGLMKILDPSNKQFVFDMGNPGNLIAISSEKNIFSVSNSFGNITVYRIYEGHERIERIHIERISCMVVSPDGRLLVTASWDKTLKIFDLENKIELYHLSDVHEGI
jgi:WD40 repeat protein